MENVICNNMDGPREYYTQWSNSDKERQKLYVTTYGWNLKTKTNEYKKTETDSQI